VPGPKVSASAGTSRAIRPLGKAVMVDLSNRHALSGICMWRVAVSSRWPLLPWAAIMRCETLDCPAVGRAEGRVAPQPWRGAETGGPGGGVTGAKTKPPRFPCPWFAQTAS